MTKEAFVALLSSRIIFCLCVPVLACSALLADTTAYTYDDAGRLTQVVYPNGKTITYAYDKAGNLLTRQVSAPDGQAAKMAKPPLKKKDRTGGQHAQ
jgi:YD repeat-containing protein